MRSTTAHSTHSHQLRPFHSATASLEARSGSGRARWRGAKGWPSFPNNRRDAPPARLVSPRAQRVWFRMVYAILNGIMVWLVYETSGSALWSSPDELDGEVASGYFLVLAFSWIAYFLVQGTDPGYIWDGTRATGDVPPWAARGLLSMVPSSSARLVRSKSRAPHPCSTRSGAERGRAARPGARKGGTRAHPARPLPGRAGRFPGAPHEPGRPNGLGPRPRPRRGPRRRRVRRRRAPSRGGP